MARSIEYQGSYEGYEQHPEIVRRAARTVAVNAIDSDDCLDLLEMLGLVAPSVPTPVRVGVQQRTIYKQTEEQRAAKAQQARERRARRRAEGKRPN